MAGDNSSSSADALIRAYAISCLSPVFKNKNAHI